MKNNLKIFLAILITAIICISGTVYALNAYDTSYNPANNNWNVGTVGDALDSLYLNSKKVPELIFKQNLSGQTTYTDYTIELEKNYNYLILVMGTSDMNGKVVETMKTEMYLTCDFCTLLGDNYYYKGSNGSSHLVEVYLIPVTGSNVVIPKMVVGSFSIYGI